MPSLTDTFKSIADAIRAKDGTTAAIPYYDFPDRIKAIPSGSSGFSLKDYFDINPSNGYYFYNQDQITNADFLQYSDTENVTNMTNMFYGNALLTSIPAINTSKVTNMGSMFNNCPKLTTIPELDTSKVTRLSNFAQYDSSLTTAGPFSIDSVEYATYMFDDCTSLKSIVITGKGSSGYGVAYMFRNCSSLESVEIDLTNAGNVGNMFTGCTSLKTCYISGLSKSLSLSDCPITNPDVILYNVNKVTTTQTITFSSITYNVYMSDAAKASAANKNWIISYKD